MQTLEKDERFAHFMVQETILDPIIVSRILSNGSSKRIGYISVDFGDYGDTPPVYSSSNIHGDELFPPTENYGEAQANFERYAKRLTLERAGQIKTVRERKGRNEKSNSITK